MNRSLLIASMVVVGTAAWVISGVSGSGNAKTEPETAAGQTQAQHRERVRVMRMDGRSMKRDVVLHGRLEPSRRVDLRAEVNGRVAAVLAAKGANVKAGQPVVRIAMDDRRERLDEARALLAQRRLERQAAEQLFRRGNGTETAAVTARAQFATAEATVRRAELDVANTEIHAPFDGVLESRSAEVGAYLDVGGAVASVVDLDPLLAVGFVSEKAVGGLRQGAVARVRVSGGPEVEGHVAYIAASAEAVTRTYRVEVEIPNPEHHLVAGLTAQLHLPQGERKAHFVPPSALSLGDDGTLGVKTVDAANQVSFVPVAILSMQDDGAWVDGLSGCVRVIVTGQEFVETGNIVEPVDALENVS